MTVEKFNLNEPVFVFMGDDFIWNPNGSSAAESMLENFEKNGDSVILGVETEREKLEKYGVLSEENGILTNIVEKPKPENAPSNLINVSKYIMTPALLTKVVEYVKTNNFGPLDQEYLVTDPIAEFIKTGKKIRVARARGVYLDGGSVEGWLHANEVVLNGEN